MESNADKGSPGWTLPFIRTKGSVARALPGCPFRSTGPATLTQTVHLIRRPDQLRQNQPLVPRVTKISGKNPPFRSEYAVVHRTVVVSSRSERLINVGTLIAQTIGAGQYQFVIRLQNVGETVFMDI